MKTSFVTTPTQLSTSTLWRKRFLRGGMLAIMVLAIGEILLVSSLYIHEPLAWPFILQAVAMFLGALSGYIIGVRKLPKPIPITQSH